MARLNEFIFGYCKGRVATDDISKLITLLLKLEICSSVAPNGEFILCQKDKARFISFAKAKMRFDIGEPLGIYGFIYRNLHRYGLFTSLILLSLIFVFSSGLVWDVRINGNENLPDYIIENALNDLGFGVGTSWRSIDKNLIEADLLTQRKDIAWISINRRGTVAYVEIMESENVGLSEESAPKYSNIIADRDGVIEEISVKCGTAVVKVGDVVKKGDILISGVVENENGVKFCRSEGSVRARSVCSVVAVAKREFIEETVKERKIHHIRIVLFNFSINIFKKYGNYANNCDIIEEIKKFALFDKYKLPIRIEKSYAYFYDEITRTRNEDDMIEAAKHELDSKVYTMFKDADVIKLRTYGDFFESGYRLTSRVVYSAEIGKESAIEIN